MRSSWCVVIALVIAGCSHEEAPPPVAPSPTAPLPPPAAATPELAPAPTVASAFPPDFPVPCIEYKDAIDQLAKCEKLPQTSRDAMKEAYTTMVQSWNASTMAPAAIQAAAEACATGRDALLQAVAVCKK